VRLPPSRGRRLARLSSYRCTCAAHERRLERVIDPAGPSHQPSVAGLLILAAGEHGAYRLAPRDPLARHGDVADVVVLEPRRRVADLHVPGGVNDRLADGVPTAPGGLEVEARQHTGAGPRVRLEHRDAVGA